jgi:hypothetical protein
MTQNDFSCMVSPAMYREFFLDTITAECAHLDDLCYHLDGPDALGHLDALLEIDTLNAVQWVPGAGREDNRRWLPVLRKILEAGKGAILYAGCDEALALIEELPHEGLILFVGQVESAEKAEWFLGEVSKRTRGRCQARPTR